MNTSIPLGPLEERLRSLRQHAPELSEALHAFGATLALHFHSSDDPITPSGFYNIVDLILEDSCRHKSVTYFELAPCIPALAHAICPPDFAARVEEYHLLEHSRSSCFF
mgnify:CR=1 FL=1